MRELSGSLIVYKDESMIVGNYTGDVSYPFSWRHRKVPNGETLHFRHTLCQPGPDYHAYAGKNAFYRFDLTTQKPQVIPTSEPCKDIFFDKAKIADKDVVFAADNTVTKEIWFMVPSSTSDKAIVWDYFWDTWSTTSIDPDAAVTLNKPLSENLYGEAEDWFIFAMGTALHIYGRADEPVAAWSPVPATPTVDAIYYRRTGTTFAGQVKMGYESRIETGMDNFGSRHSEKLLRSFVLHYASGSNDAQVNWTLRGSRNIAETPTDLVSNLAITSPVTGNLVPLHYLQHNFGYALSVPATLPTTPATQYIDKDVRLTGCTFDIAGADSKSWVRNVPP
jgi:hypothetical protein